MASSRSGPAENGGTRLHRADEIAGLRDLVALFTPGLAKYTATKTPSGDGERTVLRAAREAAGKVRGGRRKGPGRADRCGPRNHRWLTEGGKAPTTPGGQAPVGGFGKPQSRVFFFQDHRATGERKKNRPVFIRARAAETASVGIGGSFGVFRTGDR